jgi:AraC family transcriptional regulator
MSESNPQPPAPSATAYQPNVQPTDVLQPSFVHSEPLDIVGLPKNFTGETRDQIPLLWERFAKWIGHVPHQIGNVTFGVIRNNDKGRGFYYLAGVAVNSVAAVPDDLRLVRLPEQDYAVFTHRGHVSQLFETMCAIYTQWAPNAGDILADAPCLERYTEEFDPRTGHGPIEIWLPVHPN